MTIEEKARAYDEALELARDYHEDKNCFEYLKGVLENIFPELAESEDERVRKELITHCRNIRCVTEEGAERIAKWIAWLEKQGGNTPIIVSIDKMVDEFSHATVEGYGIPSLIECDAYRRGIQDTLNIGLKIEKQGEQKEYTFKSLPRLLDMIEPTSKAKAYCQKLIDTLVKEGYSTDAKIVGECLKIMNGEKVAIATMDEKQAPKTQGKTALEAIHEEKVDNANKVVIEPKFNVGDWVVCEVTGSVYQIKNCIENLNNHRYGYDLINGGYIGSDEVNHYHLWTIQDAKDGDVLCWNDSKCIVLFKNIYDKESFISYGFVGHCTGIFETRLTYPYHGIEGVHPATKEQRDLLFQKMREAGYEWNAEKKELRNIEK